MSRQRQRKVIVIVVLGIFLVSTIAISIVSFFGPKPQPQQPSVIDNETTTGSV